MQNSPDLPNGGQLGEYTLLGLIKPGGMGAVYKAQHRKLKRLVAIKVVAAHFLSDPQAQERFNREMEAVARLDHPNLIRAYDAGEVNGISYLVMEYLEGQDLEEVLNQKGTLSVIQACRIISQAATGLQYAYQNGLVHRDIKPANLFLARRKDKPGMVVRILDLGLSKLLESPAAGRLTGSGQVMGTPDYIAPEQIGQASEVDIRADIYSLGCTFYHLLVGRPPFGGNTLHQKYAAHLMHQPEPLTGLRPEVPPQLAAIVARMLAKVPADRYATPAEVAAALKPYTHEQAVLAEPGKGKDTVSGEEIILEGLPVPQPPRRKPKETVNRSARSSARATPPRPRRIEVEPLDNDRRQVAPPQSWLFLSIVFLAILAQVGYVEIWPLLFDPDRPLTGAGQESAVLTVGSWEVMEEGIFRKGSVWTFYADGKLKTLEFWAGEWPDRGELITTGNPYDWHVEHGTLVMKRYKERFSFDILECDLVLRLGRNEDSPRGMVAPVVLMSVPRVKTPKHRLEIYGFWGSTLMAAILARILGRRCRSRWGAFFLGWFGTVFLAALLGAGMGALLDQQREKHFLHDWLVFALGQAVIGLVVGLVIGLGCSRYVRLAQRDTITA